MASSRSVRAWLKSARQKHILHAERAQTPIVWEGYRKRLVDKPDNINA